MGLLKSAKTFVYLLSKDPVNATELLQLRIEKRIGLSLHVLSSRRRKTCNFEKRHTTPVDKRLKAFGNYYLSDEMLGEHPVVFSVGVGQEISFDEALLARGPVSLHLVDPTPTSKAYVEASHLSAGVTFDAVAVGDFDGEIELFVDDLEGSADTTSSLSIHDRGYDAPSLRVPCRRVGTLMRQYGHEKIDVLKLDVEGAAIRVLRDCFSSGIFPPQIAAEFERPSDKVAVSRYLAELEVLFETLKNRGYELFRTRPDSRGCQVEIVAVRFASPS